MRVLFVVERYPPDIGGVARSGSRTAETLAELGADVEVLAWTRTLPPGQLESSQPRPCDKGSITVHRLGLFSNWDLSMQHTMNVLDWMHGEAPFDAVWGHYLFPAGFVAVLFAESNALPSIVSARGNDVDRLMFPPGDFARLTWALSRAHLRTAVSRDLANKLDVLLGEKDSTTVVHNSVDVDEFRPLADATERTALRQDLGFGPDDFVLGFCGELRHKKGLPFLLSALGDLTASHSIRLLIIGEVRARERQQLLELGARLPQATDCIVETGHLPASRDVAAHLRACDLTLIPSVWDGLPNAALESMACGIPVLGSDAGGIPEVIAHDETGFIIPRAQLHRLSEAIEEILHLTPARLDEIAGAARAHMEAEFDGARERQQLSAILERLSGPGPDSSSSS